MPAAPRGKARGRKKPRYVPGPAARLLFDTELASDLTAIQEGKGDTTTDLDPCGRCGRPRWKHGDPNDKCVFTSE